MRGPTKSDFAVIAGLILALYALVAVFFGLVYLLGKVFRVLGIT